MTCRLCILMILLPAGSGIAAPELARIEGTLEDLEPRDEWFGVYVQGAKVGHCRQTIAREDEGEDARIVLATEVRMKLVAAGERHVVLLRERARFRARAPWTFIRGESFMLQGRESRLILARSLGGQLHTEIREGDSRRSMTTEAPDYTVWDALTMEIWVRRGAEVGERVSFRGFDLSESRADVSTLEITDARSVTVSGVKTRLLDGVLSSRNQGELGPVRIDDRGRVLTMTIGGVFEIRSEPEEIAKKAEYSTDLFALSIVRIDRPLGSSADLRSLVLEAGGEAAAKLESGPRQSVERGERVILRLGEGAAPPVRATEAEIAKALEATVDLPVNDPEVNKLAGEAVGDAGTTAEKVARLATFVSDYVQDAYGKDSMGVRRIIERKIGDCTEHTLLFTCLARSLGIPARQVGGLAYMGDEFRAFGGHAWSEVVIDGVWVPVDPTFGEAVADAAHIRFGADGGDEMALLFSMGRLTLRLIERNGEKR